MTQRPRPEDASGLEQPNKGIKMPSTGGLVQYAIMVIIAVAVSFVMTSYMGVTKTDFSKNIADVLNTVNSATSDVRAIKDSVNTALNNIPNTIKSQTDNTISAITSRLNSLDGTVNGFKSLTDAATTNAQSAFNTANSYSKTISDLQATITSLNNKITELQTLSNTSKSEIATLKTELATLKTRMDTLSTTPTTPTTTTPLGLSVVANNPTITLTPASGFVNAFNITITNTTSKGISGGQLTFTFQLIGLPTGESVSTALAGSPFVCDYLTWRTPTFTPPVGAYYIGDFNGYISGNSSIILTVSVDLISSSTNNLILNVGTPTFSGFITY